MNVKEMYDKFFHWVHTTTVGKIVVLSIIVVCIVLIVETEAAKHTNTALDNCLERAKLNCRFQRECDGMRSSCYAIEEMKY